ncbi:MAG: hypothetical protein ACRD2N_11265, partial [Vicinamibacterales bacterium]
MAFRLWDRLAAKRACLSATMAGLLSIACGSGTPPAATTSKPATVTAPVKEAELTTVTLTVEAEKRLAVVAVPVEQKTVPRSRTLGGEITAPSGAALSITAPV